MPNPNCPGCGTELARSHALKDFVCLRCSREFYEKDVKPSNPFDELQQMFGVKRP